ncbi:thioredoxin [Candidatus Pacearchaeota archaeon]|nr:thioredoxin [Candidatus Pacearchaeota archaeon]
MSQNVTEIVNAKEFDLFVKKGNVLIDFYADWCMPCLTMSPVFEELSKKFKGKIKFGKVDISENRELAQKFKISSIPNFIFLKDGKIKEQFIGARYLEDFEAKLKNCL